MKFKNLRWTNSDSKLPYDLISHHILGTYRIGPRWNSSLKMDEIWIFGNKLCNRTESVEEAKEIAQRNFEELYTKELFEEESCPS